MTNKTGDKPEEKSRAWNYGKRKPIKDDIGLLWCGCLFPNLRHNGNEIGQAKCMLCGYPWYH